MTSTITSSTRTNLGPLTTPFTYPASCSIAVLECLTCSRAWQAQTCSNNGNNDQGIQDNSECWPTATAPDILTGYAFNGAGIYSPGISCPAGYSTACSATYGASSGYSFQFPLLAQETAIGCCPSGFTCGHTWDQTESAQTCYSQYSTGSFPAVYCSSGTSNGFSYQQVPATVLASTSTNSTTSTFGKTISAISVNAPLFQLVFKASDLPASTTSTSSATLTTSITSTTHTIATTRSEAAAESATTSSSSVEAHQTLSTGAKAGIGVGAGVGGLAVIGVVAFLLLGRKRHREAGARGWTGRTSELSAERPKTELQGSSVASEAEGSRVVSELP